MRTTFNEGWSVKPKAAGFFDIVASRSGGTPVTLPHDAMITMDRSAVGTDGSSTGYFPGGTVEYTRTLDVPEDWRRQRVTLEFEGVYRDAMVYVNGASPGTGRTATRGFRVPLDAYLRYGADERHPGRVPRPPGLPLVLRRWASTATLHLLVIPSRRIAPGRRRVTTPDVDDERAVVAVATTVRERRIAASATLDLGDRDRRRRRRRRRHRPRHR